MLLSNCTASHRELFLISLTDVNRVYKIINITVNITQYKTTKPQTISSKMITQFSQHLSKTGLAKTKHYHLHGGRISCKSTMQLLLFQV